MKFEIIDRIGYHIKKTLGNDDVPRRLVSLFSEYDVDFDLSTIQPERAKILLYILLRDNLDGSILNNFWNCLYGQYHLVKCLPELLEKIKNTPNFN